MRRRVWKLVFGTLALSAVSVALWAADPLIGTWKLNLQKSKFGTYPATKSSTATFVAQEGGMIKYTADAVNAQGQPTHTEWSSKLDGKECPVTGSPTMDTMIGKRINTQTIEYTGKKQGKVIGTAKAVISKDGKTMTINWSVTDEKGQTQHFTTVSDKQ